MLTQQIYPVNSKLQSEIPLWLKFRAFNYQGFIGRGRLAVGSMPALGGMLATIYVPAPPLLHSGVSNKYNEAPVKGIFDSVASLISSIGSMSGFAPKNNKVLSAFEIGRSAYTAGYNLASYFTDIIPPDFNDNIYAGTNKRTYKFNLVLPCLTDEDSRAASAIGHAFESLSIPVTSSSVFTFKHPPMWGFGVGAGTGPFIDNAWLTNPLLCSLASVAVNRSAPDSGTYAILTSAGLKPAVVTIALEFVEIEPVYRRNGTLDVISRSVAHSETIDAGSLF